MVNVFQSDVFQILVFQRDAITAIDFTGTGEAVKQVCDISLTLSQFTDSTKTVEQVYYDGVAAQFTDDTKTVKTVGETSKTIKQQGSKGT